MTSRVFIVISKIILIPINRFSCPYGIKIGAATTHKYVAVFDMCAFGYGILWQN
jgi:hypothetical protein